MGNTTTFAQLPGLSSLDDGTILPCWDGGSAQGLTVGQLKAYIAAYIAATIGQTGNPTPNSQVVLFDTSDNTPWNPEISGGALSFVALNPSSVTTSATVYLLTDAADGTLWQVVMTAKALRLVSVAVGTQGTNFPNLIDLKDGTTWHPSVSVGKLQFKSI